MDYKIPLPTDSLYKFVALFSIALLIGAFYVVVYASNNSNSIVYEHWGEYSALQNLEVLNKEQAVRKEIVER